MLTESDVEWIKSNRSEITESRSESVTLVHTSVTGNDPYTDEPITETTTETVAVIWREIPSTGGDYDVIGGVELRKGDVKVTFDADVILSDVTKITRAGVDYTLVVADERGIGERNRYECVVRRVT
jgi:hypothetical protein